MQQTVMGPVGVADPVADEVEGVHAPGSSRLTSNVLTLRLARPVWMVWQLPSMSKSNSVPLQLVPYHRLAPQVPGPPVQEHDPPLAAPQLQVAGAQARVSSTPIPS